MSNDYLTIKEVATLYRVSTSTIRRLLRSGKLFGHRIGSQWRFDPNEVKQAIKDGLLSSPVKLPGRAIEVGPLTPPEWAEPLILKWRSFINQILTKFSPEHVVLLDRRGAKIWSYLLPPGYRWGENLWHSTALDYMTSSELKEICNRRRILLFDEMIQHGREMLQTRQRFMEAGAEVQSVVLVRRKSHAESGILLEYEAHYCEDLDDREFSVRTSQISELLKKAQPPLDVDHLVVKGILDPDLTPDELIQRLSDWGMPYVIWEPECENELLAITLDRPQFYETKESYLPGLALKWNGPCKVRLYIDPEKRYCYCSFIAFPSIEGPQADWISAEAQISTDINGKEKKIGKLSDLPFTDERLIKHVYSRIYADLALDMLSDFVESGAATKIGIRLNENEQTLDIRQLWATYGRSLGDQIYKKASQIIAKESGTERLFFKRASSPLSLFIRLANINALSFDTFSCRRQVLSRIPRKFDTHNPQESPKDPIEYEKVYALLPTYSESTVGKVLDEELDLGTVKPVSKISKVGNGVHETSIVSVARSFQRGEFGSWFEQGKSVITEKDRVIRKTIGLCPFVIDSFQKFLDKTTITGTHFAKLFTNLQHDWQKELGPLFLGWKPYKYGPLPTVPNVDSAGNYQLLENFLSSINCLKIKHVQHGAKKWRTFSVPDSSVADFDWKTLFESTLGPFERAHVRQLVRLYSEIQKKCTTHRSSASGQISVFKDPLVVLASARNSRIAYICCWFEFEDWIKKGATLFPHIEVVASSPPQNRKAKLSEQLILFAEPAKLLMGKIEMYRAVPELRQQITKLIKDKGDLEVGEVLLSTVDQAPIFDSIGTSPLRKMEWAARSMRAFSTLTRQVLTTCGLDEITSKKIPAPPEEYLNELIEACQEMTPLKSELIKSISDSKKGVLTTDIAACLAKTFRMLSSLLEANLPNPMPDKGKLITNDVLCQKLMEIQLKPPYAVVVADIRNFQGLLNICEIFGSGYDQAMVSLMDWVKKISSEAVKKYDNVTPPTLTNDNIIFAGIDVNDIVKSLMEITRRLFQQLGRIDQQFAYFGILRAGIAWRDDSMGAPLTGVKPGLLAFNIGDKTKLSVGDICITKLVYDRLDASIQKDFEVFETPIDEISRRAKEEQGGIYIRRFNRVRDLS